VERSAPRVPTTALGRWTSSLPFGGAPFEQAVGVVAVAAAGVAAGLVLTEGLDRIGNKLVLLPVLVVAAWYLVLRPGAALAAFVVTTVLFESSGDGLWGLSTEAWYGFVGPLQGPDLLLGVLVVSVLLHATRALHREGAPVRLRLVGPFTAPLALLAAALAFGLVMGRAGGAAPADVVPPAKAMAYLVIVPFLAAAVLVDAEQRRKAIGVMAGLILFKAAFGVSAFLVGQAAAFGEEGQLTYYEAPTNHLSVLYLLAVVVAPFAKVPLPRWVVLGTPVVAASLVLSFRRSFWIAFVLALALTLIVASGQRGRPWLFLGGAAVVLALWLALSGGGTTQSDNEIVQRARSISPTAVQQSADDRYRIEEQQNVIEELRRQPITGLGLGVPWTARHALSEEHVGGRQYTHVTFLFFWLRLGVLGLLAYVWIVGTTVWTALRTWSRSSIGLDRVVGLALAAGTVGLTVAETTAAFTGVDLRISVLVGASIGWLASAVLDDQPEEPSTDLPERRDGQVAVPSMAPS
jgi:O-antigen ligase